MDKEKIKAELEALRPKPLKEYAKKRNNSDLDCSIEDLFGPYEREHSTIPEAGILYADNIVYEQIESVNRPIKTVEMLISSSGVAASDYVKTIDMFNHYGKNGMKWGNKK